MASSSCGLLCTNYGSLTFTGPQSGVIIENGGEITDGTTFGGGSNLYISVKGTKFWSGDGLCFSNCGTYQGDETFSETTSEPQDIINPLPVEMLYFTGNFSKGSVLLEWATATELNNSHFEIERSADDFDFYKIGEVMGNGNSNTQIEYSFKDDAIPLTQNILYYRIKQVDFDGQYEYHEIIAVYNEILKPIELKTWPNPFSERFIVFLRLSSSDNINVRLYNMEGQEVFSQFYPVKEGLSEFEIDKLYDLPPGIYSLFLTGNLLSFKEKIVKSR